MAKIDGGITPEKYETYVYNITLHNKILEYTIIYLPKSVPKANGNNGTPTTGATKLINQFGNKGVILRNNI